MGARRFSQRAQLTQRQNETSPRSTALRSGGGSQRKCTPKPPPGSAFPPPFILHAPLSTRLLEISLSLAVSKRSIFWPVWPPGAPRGPLQPSQIQKIVGARSPPCTPPLRRCATGAPLRGARAGLRPTRSPTAISNPTPNLTAISTGTADFVYLCSCPPPDLRIVAPR